MAPPASAVPTISRCRARVAIAKALAAIVPDSDARRRALPGNSAAWASTLMPPSEAPIAAYRVSMPKCSTATCALRAMSSTLSSGQV